VPHILAWLEDKGSKQGEFPALYKECRLLYKELTIRRTLQWTPGHYGQFLPARELGESLMNAYLRTFETIYRIFHVPTLTAGHEKFWDDPDRWRTECKIQIQLCYALGALYNDDKFKLRYHAVQWIREAECWLDRSAKPRPTIATIQTMCLLTLVREHTQATYGDKVYMHSGALLHAALSIGLQRDPEKLPRVPFAQAEMRRRIWATVLELVLDSCLNSGSPPLISEQDFDCKLPANLNDSQLQPDSKSETVSMPHDSNVFTDTTLQIALGKLFLNRLRIAKYSNGIARNENYEYMMKISNDYNAACRAVVGSLQTLQSKMPTFQRKYCEMVITRYIFTLHVPYLTMAVRNSQYFLSGKACLDAALNVVASGLRPPIDISSNNNIQQEQCHDDFIRLSMNSSGATRSVMFQALMIITAGLIAIIKGTKSSVLWSESTRALHNSRAIEFLSILRHGAAWSKERLEAGGAHNRDHPVIWMAVTGSEAMLMDGNVDDSLKSGALQACKEMRDAYTSLIDMSDLTSTIIQTSLEEEEEEDLWGLTDLWMAQPEQLGPNLLYF